ncbi:hypothetical protein VNI00_004267 [Paramarasmius palmivorus]|uniref:MPN domain-containing protein n=1 Tax=Paramarasmius palmivorus TaxID=297713 RepID=A0AAW0DRB4_9AGAR
MSQQQPQPQFTQLTRRPSSIAELAQKARNHHLKENQPIKYYLKHAESNRREGMKLVDQGDLEGAFISFARTASLVLETLPTHAEYKTVLDEKQRTNLNLNGQEILDNLGKLKVKISDRFESWRARHPEGDAEHQKAVEAQIAHEYAEQEKRRYEDIQAQRNYDEMGKRNEVAAQDAQERAEKLRRSLERMDLGGVGIGDPQQQQRISSAVASARNAAVPYDGARYQTPVQEASTPIHGQRAQDAVSSAKAAASSAAYVPMPAPYLQQSSSSSSALKYPQPVSIPQFTPTKPPQQRPRPPSFVGPHIMPLEGPSSYDGGDSTDSESQPEYTHRPPSRAPPYPAPVTTSSIPSEGIQYPQLMTQHQKTQGYTPSLKSRFSDTHPHQQPNEGSLLLGGPSSSSSSSSALYPPHALPQPPPQPPQPPHPPYHHQQHQPRPAPIPPPQRPPPEPERISRTSSGLPELKTVIFPRECLSKFLNIASINTSRNLETCGLLLGREHSKAGGNKYVVSTLLIPKQHATSDTCTMDEEELVMQFTEERNLITLGWIHTHPTQSCFMSSVDLHTHSGFQRMLPESFAVVCAPRSNPNFGIFRLTDPPGLKTILDCRAKEAFHPHPDIPIYTDADRGHVQMKDMALAIVDLRE